jgi:hypothetical protein
MVTNDHWYSLRGLFAGWREQHNDDIHHEADASILVDSAIDILLSEMMLLSS